MELSKGISLLLDPNIDVEDKISLSSGSEKIVPHSVDEMMTYSEYYVRPKKPWANAQTDALKNLIWLDASSSLSNIISLRKIPSSIMQHPFLPKLQNSSSRTELNSLIVERQEEAEDFIKLALDFIKGIAIPDLYLRLMGIIANPCSLETVSHTKANSYIGLHLDTSLPFDPTAVEDYPNRIVLNIGREPRYLLFVNKSVKQMLEMIREIKPGVDIHELNDATLVQLFFSLFPQYPITRLLQSPGEAYIAPTDNIIHDASTIDSRSLDITIMATGYFNPVVIN